MLIDDPKEPKDETPEVEPDEDDEDETPEEEDSPEPEAEDEDEVEPEGDEDQAEEEPEPEDDELPNDPKVLKQMLRRQNEHLTRTQQLAEQAIRRQPPTGEEPPDELASVFDELAKRDPAAAKLVSHLKSEIDSIKGQTVRAAKDSAALAKVPRKHQADVQAISDRFGLPTVVAHQIYKGALYDQLQKRHAEKKAKARGGAPPEEPVTRPPVKPTLTRPVRRAPESPNGGAGTLVVQGLKLKQTYKPGEYATMMDTLTPEKRKVVLALRREGKIKVG